MKVPAGKTSGSFKKYWRVKVSSTVAWFGPDAGGADWPLHGRMYIACVVVSIACETRASCCHACVYASKPLPSPASSMGPTYDASVEPSQMICKSSGESGPTLGVVMASGSYG